MMYYTLMVYEYDYIWIYDILHRYMSQSTVPCIGHSQHSSLTGDQQPLWITMPSIKF